MIEEQNKARLATMMKETKDADFPLLSLDENALSEFAPIMMGFTGGGNCGGGGGPGASPMTNPLAFQTQVQGYHPATAAGLHNLYPSIHSNTLTYQHLNPAHHQAGSPPSQYTLQAVSDSSTPPFDDSGVSSLPPSGSASPNSSMSLYPEDSPVNKYVPNVDQSQGWVQDTNNSGSVSPTLSVPATANPLQLQAPAPGSMGPMTPNGHMVMGSQNNSPPVSPAPDYIPFSEYPSESKDGRVKLVFIKPPETHHRARYLTEGSRGAIRDSTGRGYPVVRLCGYSGTPIQLQCYLCSEDKLGQPHLFYQASEIVGRNITPCQVSRVDGTNIIEVTLNPADGMQAVINCVGIQKERIADVERRVRRQSRRKNWPREIHAIQLDLMKKSSKRSTHCRLVFRARLPTTGEVLQIVSNRIQCTQLPGYPEVHKVSSIEGPVTGGKELIVIGKNFTRDSKVMFRGAMWEKEVTPQQAFLHPMHLVVEAPPYDGPLIASCDKIPVYLSVVCGQRSSEQHQFFYNNTSKLSSPTGHSHHLPQSLHGSFLKA